MTMVRLRVVAILTVGIISGCGASGTSVGTTTGNTRSPFAVFSAHVVLKGEMKVSGSFSDSLTARHETCAAYADGQIPATTLFVVPTPYDTTNVSGHTVQYTAGVPINNSKTGYHGPGTYTGVSALVSVLLIDNASYLPGNNATATITVGIDGSGSLSFSGLQDVATNAPETGAVTWTCSD
ncbi:MAG TPA: hypothetical protein VI434_14635 [Candidatus Dormibacteraeota bacterium]